MRAEMIGERDVALAFLAPPVESAAAPPPTWWSLLRVGSRSDCVPGFEERPVRGVFPPHTMMNESRRLLWVLD